MIYSLHQPPDLDLVPGDETGESRFDRLVAVPESSAKAALFFPPLWLAWHGLWWPLAFYGIAAVFGLALLATPYLWVVFLIGGLPTFYVFLEGNQLRRNKLESQGFQIVGIVDGQDEQHAISRFISRLPKNVRSEQPHWKPRKAPQPRPDQDDNLAFGLFPETDS